MSTRLLPLGAAVLALALWPGGAPAASSRVTLEGTLLVKHADVFHRGVAEYWYWLRTPSGRVRLKPSGRLAETLGEARVRIRGTRVGSTVRVARGGLRVLSTQRLASASQATGNVRLGVILFNFQNNTAQPYSIAQATSTYFGGSGSMADYYSTQSFGQISVTGDVYGWYTIGYDQSGCSFNTWGNAALAKARAAGVDLNAYDIVQFVFPRTADCGWSGLANTPGSYSWINGAMQLRVTSHELGHNIGAHHASSISCTGSGGRRVAIAARSNCSPDEYGDPFDVMGGGVREMNNFHKGQYGWFGPLTVSTTGTYTVTPLEQSGGTPLVRVARGDGTYFYLEFRQPAPPYDNFAPSDPVVNGVTIRIAPSLAEIVQSELVDSTPETAGYLDSALPVGQTVTDPVSGISFTTQSVSPSGANVRVQIGGPPPPPPPPPPPSAATKYLVGSTGSSPPAGSNVTITAQLATSSGTPVATAGKTVTWSKTGSGGSFSSPTSTTNGGGAATVSFTTGPVAGTAYTVTATDTASLTGTSGTITTTPGPASPATTTISAAPSSLLADGSSSATVTVQAKDAYGNNLTSSGGPATLTSTRGTLSAVTNSGNGSYAATLTAPTTPGTAAIGGTISGSSISSTATVTFRAEPAKYVVSTSSTSPVAGFSVTVTAQLADQDGNAVALAGKNVTWSADGSGSFGSATSTTNSGGVATVSFATSAAAGTSYTVTATDDSSPPLSGASPSFTTVAGLAHHLDFTSPAADLAAGGTRELSVQVEDSNGNLVSGDAGRTITFAQSSGSGSLSGLGPATTSAGAAARVVAGGSAGTVAVTASSPGLGSASLSFSVAAGAATQMTFTSATDPLISGSARILTVELRDSSGNPAAAAGPVTFAKTSGPGSVSGLGSKSATAGAASVTIVGELAGSVTISASSGPLSATTTFSVVPGAAEASKTTLSAAPASISADGKSVSTITVHVKDAAGNQLTGSAGAIALHASAGRLSSVTDLHDGTYVATLTAGLVPGRAVIGGDLAGEAIGGEVTVTLEAQCVVPRLRGKTLAAAKATLRKAHCAVGKVKRAGSKTVGAGKVVSQHPGAGRRLNAGAKVNLAVSSGRRR